MSAANIENVSTSADKAKLVLVVALVVAALAGFYTLVGGLVAAVVVFLLSLPGRQLVAFGNDAWREVNKVVWPTRKESTQMTLYVFAFVVIMALFLWLTDKTLEWVFYDLILGWKK
jgi:preprotein translocase subunit SecE